MALSWTPSAAIAAIAEDAAAAAGAGAVLGVGADVESLDALAAFDPAALRHCAERWLHDRELEWWVTQPAPAAALVVALSGKEAAFKALPTHTLLAADMPLPLSGGAPGGEVTLHAASGPVRLALRCRLDGGVVVSVAVARSAGAADAAGG
jgi:hypothetical protein